MSKLAIPEWAVKRLNTRPADVNAQADEPVNAQPKKSRSGSKHPPGYMTVYMRKWRAK